MQSILNEISRLRHGKPLTIDHHNSNRYRLLLQESDGSKTGYYFSAPIYHCKTRKLLDLKFHSNGNLMYARGSNSNITLSDDILIENAEGFCRIALSNSPIRMSQNEVAYPDGITISPTTNGIALKSDLLYSNKLDLIIEVGQPFLGVRSNDKYFALMKERFRPLIVFSCIGAFNEVGNLIAPLKMNYQKLTDTRYRLTVSANAPLARYLLIEANLYEGKLFQDTTVESLHPTTNNAFGSVGLIGYTPEYGEQWLYARPDYSKMTEIMSRHINRVILHMPKLNATTIEWKVFQVTRRFCSFGSNWDNKIPPGVLISDVSSGNGYQCIDLTPLLVDAHTHTMTKSEGFILKPKEKAANFSAIATGDSYYAPQILQIHYQ